uniref:Uncharacterized protein n=1 Tax=Brugia timori TaxID=42155 RepID=A0A0R3R8H1_9BILA
MIIFYLLKICHVSARNFEMLLVNLNNIVWFLDENLVIDNHLM